MNKMCECGCGRIVRLENRFVLGHNRNGKHSSEETKEKMSKANSGRIVSKETRKKLSDAKSGENHPMWGKHHTAEAKKKIGDANRNPSLEVRKKISDARKGNHRSKETREKISKAHEGKYCSKETREKISKANGGKNNPMYGKSLSLEHKKKISKANKGRLPPPIRTSRGKYSLCNKGHWVRSTWERKVANFLFSNSIDYEYEPKRFILNNKFSYLPDFYIPKQDLYVEVKGYMSSKSKIQHKLFERKGYNLLVIDKDIYPNFEDSLNFYIENNL